MLIYACESGVLVADDYLIVDNAAVHHGDDSAELVATLLGTFGVELVFLPAYSPGLNPCELVFYLPKREVRNNPETDREAHVIDLALETLVDIRLKQSRIATASAFCRRNLRSLT
jgi:transposase